MVAPINHPSRTNYIENRKERNEWYNRVDWNSLFTYNEETGEVFAKIGWPNRPKGSKVGFLDPDGYLKVKQAKSKWYLHRIIYVMCYGPIQFGLVIDHRDRIKTNNRIDNLRAVPEFVNANNKEQTELTGIITNPSGSYSGRVMFKRKWYTTGAYENLSTVIMARKLLREELHNGCPIVSAK